MDRQTRIGTGGAFMRLWVGKQHAVELKFIFLSPAARVFAEVLENLCEPAFFKCWTWSEAGLCVACHVSCVLQRSATCSFFMRGSPAAEQVWL